MRRVGKRGGGMEGGEAGRNKQKWLLIYLPVIDIDTYNLMT